MHELCAGDVCSESGFDFVYTVRRGLYVECRRDGLQFVFAGIVREGCGRGDLHAV